MTATPSRATHHFTAPVPSSTAEDLVKFLEHKGPPWVDDIRRRVRRELPGAEDHYFVAMDQGHITAHVWYTVSTSDPRLGLIGHVYTHPQCRRRGISRQLLEAAMAEFRRRGGVIMQLFTSTPFTIGLYEDIGFENLFTATAYHDQDWYMRYPIGSGDVVQQWFSATPTRIRKLAPCDLPQYCLLYNSRQDLLLKDRAQQIGFGLEAELAFIDMLQAMKQGRAACFVLDNNETIVGAASLSAGAFPHQSHIGLFDMYVTLQARSQLHPLARDCLQLREELGIRKVYAMSVDAAKRELLLELGFLPLSVLTDHYRVGKQFHDCELLQWAP